MKKIKGIIYCLLFAFSASGQITIDYTKLPKDSLIKIGRFLKSKEKEYEYFSKNTEKINEVVDNKNFVQNSIMSMIYREEIEPYDKTDKPDWDEIEKMVVSKYGNLGEERVWGNRMIYYSSKADWVNFGKYYKLYFDRAIPFERSFIHINNLSWPVVEHMNDSAVLKTAVKTMKYNIDKFQPKDPNALDTYANLLYKVGRKEEAIEIEEKAVQLSNSGKEFVKTLEKMKRGDIIWPVQ